MVGDPGDAAAAAIEAGALATPTFTYMLPCADPSPQLLSKPSRNSASMTEPYS
jgi:hypothetical protein